MSAAESVPRPASSRARQDLAAAELLAAHGFSAQAVEAAARSALGAAQLALAALDESRDHPSDVVSAYVRRVVRERAMDPDTGRRLRSLLNRAELAARTRAETPAAESTDALADARAVLDAVEQWLADPARSAPGTVESTRHRVRPLPRRRASET
ncbi:hypothetical protein [Pseudonocardia sp. WMMC193]|uniref:hypothetical protein n=1 Tax=Pseudonocardia sp. WMMC193 TaxID=2911965 RepID=UPI001F350DC2|nr:hypothetical protein [Pseudonocardia sp. WMMC193]MCF7551959.1 hypothetical protein [Pseudonocardia sp. WMMC193]